MRRSDIPDGAEHINLADISHKQNGTPIIELGTFGGASDPVFNCVWSSSGPSNVKAFSWRLLLHRLPTKVNLGRRQILLSQTDPVCKLCAGEEEAASHLFCSCLFAWEVWSCCYCWFGLLTVLPIKPREHLLRFKFGWNKDQISGSYTVWSAVVWSIWLMQNECVFRNREPDMNSVLELIKWRSWLWIKYKWRGFASSFFEWYSSPLLCLASS
ncbi:uncharacterized protein LOC130733395 [Lotus japonicus]|uniref:uncharacterized protein LOC130733395 n=1 Tax=Lotus japonicus TaxID=34305 RepID=UPI0025870057|nr:uncharacterized protein LOC130733395 [Lotus japonicus]